MILCPVCQMNAPEHHPVLGILPCLVCKARRDRLKSPDHIVEFTSQSIKEERKQYAKDIQQPFRGNEASKEFIEAYPEKAKKMFSEKERKNARNVWK